MSNWNDVNWMHKLELLMQNLQWSPYTRNLKIGMQTWNIDLGIGSIEEPMAEV